MIAYRIIKLRKGLGISQAQLAKKLHVSASAEANYEQGRRLPSVDTLILMSQIFDVSLDYLVTGAEHIALREEPTPCACPCDICFRKGCGGR